MIYKDVTWRREVRAARRRRVRHKFDICTSADRSFHLCVHPSLHSDPSASGIYTLMRCYVAALHQFYICTSAERGRAVRHWFYLFHLRDTSAQIVRTPAEGVAPDFCTFIFDIPSTRFLDPSNYERLRRARDIHHYLTIQTTFLPHWHSDP